MVRFLALLAASTAVVGCGGETERPAAEVSATATATATAAAKSPAMASTVTIKGFTYDPARVTVRRGAEVTWKNEDASNHTVTFTAGKGTEKPKGLGNLRAGRKGTVTFKGRGSYAYVCDFHPGMAGTVEVR